MADNFLTCGCRHLLDCTLSFTGPATFKEYRCFLNTRHALTEHFLPVDFGVTQMGKLWRIDYGPCLKLVNSRTN